MVTLASSATWFVVEADPVSWAEPHADLWPWGTEQELCSALRAWPRWRAAMAFAKRLCCWLSETPPQSSILSPPGAEPGGGHWGWGRGQASLTWAGSWHWSTCPEKQHRTKWNCPYIPHTLWVIPAFMVKYRSKKPETTQNLLSLKKKEGKKET